MSDDIVGAGPLADAARPDTDTDADGGDRDEGPGDGDDDVLVQWYRRYIGEPESRVDVYLGFGLFFGGVALGLAGLLLFVVERVVVGDDPVFWLRTVAFSVGAFGLPVLMLGVVVLLPVDQRALYAASAGLVVCLSAIGVFVWAYPYDWNVVSEPDYSTIGVTVYAVGLIAVVASAGAALVSYHVERVAPGEGGAAAAAARAGGTDAAAESVSEEQVRRDIDEAMADADLSWGGVRKSDTRRIELNADEEPIDRSSFDSVEATTTRSESGVDDAVASLRHLRGGEERRARGGGTDQQTAALRELRERQRQEEAASRSSSLFGRLRTWLRGDEDATDEGGDAGESG